MPSETIPLTTASLLDGLKHRNDQQWYRFVHTFGPLVVSWIYKAGVARADVEDLAQDVFAAANSAFPRYRHDSAVTGSFRRWLWGITRNKVAKYRVALQDTPRAWGGSTAHNLIGELPDSPFEEGDDSVDQVKINLANRAIAVMKTDFEERTWQAFWQTAIEGQPSKEVALRLDMSSNQVRQSRSRVLRRIREEFGTELNVLRR